MLDHFYAVIMAGGGGTRLWPLSRKARPKQMLSLFDERSLFQTSVQRLQGLLPPERIFVVTVQEQWQELSVQCPEIPQANFLIEPMPRGTASVVGLAAVALQNIDPHAVMAVLTADHYIGKETRFRHVLAAACEVAHQGYLVTLGIQPTFAATGFGYIQRGECLGQYRDQDYYHVLRFVEKPDQARAGEMLDSGEYSWNSGMFFWKVERILEEFQRQMPDLASGLDEIHSVWGAPEQTNVIQKIWESLYPQTIDYGVMEGARDVVVLPVTDLGWSDVGSWDSLFDVLEGDPEGNIVMGGEHVGLDTQDSLIYVNQEHRLIVTIGVENLVVVDTGDVLLVCGKDQAQRVRQVVNQLIADGREYV